MPTATANLALPIPADTDSPDFPTAMQALANGIDAYFGAWSSWTPVVTQNATLTMTTNYAKFKKIGHWCEFVFKLTYSSGTATGGTKVTVTLPVNSAVNGLLPLGMGHVFDSSATQSPSGLWMVDSGVNNKMVLELAGGLAGVATFTAALAAGDVLYGAGVCEV